MVKEQTSICSALRRPRPSRRPPSEWAPERTQRVSRDVVNDQSWEKWELVAQLVGDLATRRGWGRPQQRHAARLSIALRAVGPDHAYRRTVLDGPGLEADGAARPSSRPARLACSHRPRTV